MVCSSNKNVIFFISIIFTNFWREIEKIRIVASLCQHIFCTLYFSVSISCNSHLDVFRILRFAIQKLLHCAKVASKVLRICVFWYVHGENKTFDKNQYKKNTIKTTPYSTYTLIHTWNHSKPKGFDFTITFDFHLYPQYFRQHRYGHPHHKQANKNILHIAHQ